MKNQMTSSERLTAAMTGQPVDHLPFAPFLAYFWEAQPADIRTAGRRAFLTDIGADMLWRGAPSVLGYEMRGVDVRENRRGGDTAIEYETPVGTLREVLRTSANGDSEFLVEHMIKELEDYKTLQWIEEHTRVYMEPSRAQQHLLEDGSEGVSLAFPIHERSERAMKTAFQALTEHYVGTERLTFDLYDEPELVADTLAVMRERNRDAVRLTAEDEHYKWFLTFEDSSTQNYSPAMYREFVVPELTEWCEILATGGKQYVQHACGHLKHLFADIASQNVWGIESISPPGTGNIEPSDVRDELGPEFGLIGGIEPVVLDQIAERELPAYLEGVVRGLAGKDGTGRFVLANSDSCPPGVSISKLRTISEWARGQRQ